MAARGANEDSPLLSRPSQGSWGPSGCGDSAASSDAGSVTGKDTVATAWVISLTGVCAVIALPFVFGTWCWPTFVGMKTTPSGLWLCHSLQFATMLTVLSNLVQYYFYVCKGLQQWGPFISEFVAMVLLMVFPTVVIMRDLGLSPALCKKPLFSASLHASTYAGFVLLLCGAVWATGGFRAASEKLRYNIHGKAAVSSGHMA